LLEFVETLRSVCQLKLQPGYFLTAAVAIADHNFKPDQMNRGQTEPSGVTRWFDGGTQTLSAFQD
jgi:hypothetical protein